jgi:DNA-binding response OmpR family regulator
MGVHAMASKKKSILLVDDEKNLVDMVTEILEIEGYKVIPAFNGEECLKVLKKQRVDLIILDLMMPKADGWVIYRKIKETPEWSDVRIMILTAKTDTIDRNIGLEIAKVDDFITKPFVPEDLLNRIKEILEK